MARGFAPWECWVFVGAREAWMHAGDAHRYDPALVVDPDRHDLHQLDLSVTAGLSARVVLLEETLDEDVLANVSGAVLRSAMRSAAQVELYLPQMRHRNWLGLDLGEWLCAEARVWLSSGELVAPREDMWWFDPHAFRAYCARQQLYHEALMHARRSVA